MKRARAEKGIPLCGSLKTARVDLGLALLSIHAEPGRRYTHEEIAEWCGCTRAAIYLIELEALRKLRNRLQFMKDPVLRELVQHFTARKSC